MLFIRISFFCYRFDMLKCRLAGAARSGVTFVTFVAAAVVLMAGLQAIRR